MAHDVLMPKHSAAMEEGTILRWLKAAGDVVRRGDALAEIETDKATITFEADADGVVELLAAEGETLPVGTVIARIGEGALAAVPPPAPAQGAATSAKGAAEVSEPTRAQQTLARRVSESKATVPDAVLRTE